MKPHFTVKENGIVHVAATFSTRDCTRYACADWIRVQAAGRNRKAGLNRPPTCLRCIVALTFTE
jgi:hypothetical protein